MGKYLICVAVLATASVFASSPTCQIVSKVPAKLGKGITVASQLLNVSPVNLRSEITLNECMGLALDQLGKPAIVKSIVRGKTRKTITLIEYKYMFSSGDKVSGIIER